MKKSLRFLIVMALIMWPLAMSAQFSIQRQEDTKINDMNNIFDEDFRVDGEMKPEFFDRAAWMAEKRRVRKERNTFEFKASLEGSMQQFENWQNGGENTLSGLGTVYMNHKYKKEKFSTDFTMNLKYGMNVIDDKSFKNVDLLSLSGSVSRAMNDIWSYSGVVSFRSQFTDGFKSRTDETLKSAFMAPGYLDVSLGFTYNKKGSPFHITLSPISGNMIFVKDDRIDPKAYGVEEGKTTLNQAGPSINVKFEDKYGQKDNIQYRSTFYSFSNLSIAPTVRWENTVEVNLTKFLKTTFYWVLYYQKSASTALQHQYSATIGLSYNFKNK
ncbi:MAG: DUF3078 domain-containing protein [Tidjanibacter sp.]|nr:DUF3078 domain-containing protein [Tidjanibacter sp.]